MHFFASLCCQFLGKLCKKRFSFNFLQFQKKTSWIKNIQTKVSYFKDSVHKSLTYSKNFINQWHVLIQSREYIHPITDLFFRHWGINSKIWRFLSLRVWFSIKETLSYTIVRWIQINLLRTFVLFYSSFNFNFKFNLL